MEKQIIALLQTIKPYEYIDENTELIESKIIDSLAIIHLTSLLEDTFAVNIPDDVMTKENFSNVRSIASFVKKAAKSHYECDL